MPTDDERAEVFRRLEAAQREVAAVSGRFLAVMVEIEGLIERSIVYFFAPDELTILVDTILDRLNATTKMKAFRRILKELDLHEENRDLLREIDRLREQRNRFAHQSLHFMGNSFMFRPEGYELFAARTFDLGAPADVDDMLTVSDLEALLQRAEAVTKPLLDLHRAAVEAHRTPKEYFRRAGWRPETEEQ